MLVSWAIVRRVGVGFADVRALGAEWWRPRWGALTVASVAMAGGMLASAALWGRLVRELSGHRIPPLRAIRIFLSANLARYIPGKVWQVAGLAMMARREGVGAVLATSAAVLGQLAALAAATLLGAGVLVSAGGTLRTWGWAAVAAVVVGVALASVPSLGDRLVALWFRARRLEAPASLHPGPTFAIRWLGLYVLNWVVYAGAFWLFAASFDLDGTFFQMGGAFAAAYVLGYVAVFAPAGLGVRESFLVVFIGPVAGPGPAAGLAIVSRVWTTLVEVGAALFSLAVGGPRLTAPAPGDAP